ncbi:Ankyrin-1 [Termitomyces sp. J132]|nr:Ankyrin-1 [Termitomyces sp. J132]
MPGLLLTSGTTTFGTASLGGRNYDYTKIYSPDKQGDEAKENARVWNVYLDEAENYDTDMIQGFQNIIDGLLVFASLFSAVVTTFVAQTSQALQPDNTQIMVSLLIENNQLLRAAGNRASISAVHAASPGPGSRTYTSIDVWVNGLFFTSLALSLSTALLTVLAKQWIQVGTFLSIHLSYPYTGEQAYTAIVPGDAKTRALIRHFRFQGLIKWKLGDIVESLPLILHGSVAIFLVGLALYVSKLSSPICGVVSAITALAFFFYFTTSLLPAFSIACPYRVSFMFSLIRPFMFAFRVIKCALLTLWYTLTRKSDRVIWPEMSRKSVKMTEHSEVFVDSHSLLGVAGHLACDSLEWLLNHSSSNHSAKEIVAEGACGLLDEWPSSLHSFHPSGLGRLASISEHNFDLFLSTVEYALSQMPELSSTSMTEDEVDQSTCGRLIENLLKISSSKSLLDGRITYVGEDWRERIEDTLINAYRVAIKRRCHVLSRRILDWGYPNLLRYDRQVLFHCAKRGKAEDICDLLDRGINIDRRDTNGWTALHFAAYSGNLDVVILLVEREPSLVSIETTLSSNSETALHLAVEQAHSDVVAYLLDHGAIPPPNTLHVAAFPRFVHHLNPCLVVNLLDRGWDRSLKDADGRTPLDIARSEGHHAIVEHLEHYQTVKLPPNPIATISLEDT